MIRTRTHARVEDGLPVLCECQLGYHHTPDGSPLAEADEKPGRHPYCVGACRFWGTPTEEFDYRLVTGKRVAQNRIVTTWEVADLANPGSSAVAHDNDTLAACRQLGIRRRAAWERQRQQTS